MRLAALVYGVLFTFMYGRALALPLWHDDVIWLYHARALDGVGGLFVPHHFPFVRPLTMAWFWILSPLCGTTPWAWRLASAALYLATALGLYALVARLTEPTTEPSTAERSAFVSGLLFVTGAHHWELVLGVAAVGDLLVGFFLVAMALAAVRGRQALSLACCAFAMLSKESGCIAPLLMTFLDFAVQPRPGRWRRVLPFWALTGLIVGLEIAQVGAAGSSPNLSGLMTWGRMVSATLFTYAGADALLSDAVARGAATALFIAMLGLATWGLPRLAFFGGWMVVAWLPYLVLASGQLDQDRYSYLSSMGAAGLYGMGIGLLLAAPGLPRAIRAGFVAATVLFIAWNVRLAARSEAALSAWLDGRRGMALEATRAAAAVQGPAYVYAHPEAWHEPGYTLALYGGLAPGAVHDWYDVLEARPPTPTLLFWDEERNVYTDMSRFPPGRTSPTLRQPRDLSSQPWGARGIDLSTLPRLTVDGAGLLESPPIDLDPWDFWSVEVDYAVLTPLAPGTQMRLSWSSDKDSTFDRFHTVAVALHEDGPHRASIFPSTRAEFWSQGRIQRFYLQPADHPATMEIRGVWLRPIPPPELRRRF